MHRKLLVLVFAGLILISGCGRLGTKSFEGTCRQLAALKSYTCEVVMKTTNNKSTKVYKLKHAYMHPGKYRVEVLEPEELTGQVTVYNGRQAFIYHPSINQFLMTESFSGSTGQNAFAGSFLQYLSRTEKLKVSTQQIEARTCFVVELDISDNSRHMCRQKLWIDKAAGVPVKSEIYDADGKIVVELSYANFKSNVKLQDKDFEAAAIQ